MAAQPDAGASRRLHCAADLTERLITDSARVRPGVRRAGLPRQSPARRRAAAERSGAALIPVRPNSAVHRASADRALTSCTSRTAGLFVPKPSTDADCQRRRTPGLAWDRPSVGVRWRPPLAVVIVTHLVTRPLASRCSERLFRRSSRASLRPVTSQFSDYQHVSPWMTALLLPYSLDRAGLAGTPALPPAYRPPETSLDAEANGRVTRLHQALSSPAGHFAAQCPRVSCDENKQIRCSRPRQRRNYCPGEELSEQSW